MIRNYFLVIRNSQRKVVIYVNIAKKIYYGVISAALLAPVLALADSGVVPPGQPIKLSSISQSIDLFARFMVYIGVAVAVIFIVWGGITYMTAGGDDTKLGTAKKRIIWGIVGAAIIIGVGVIINTLKAIATGGVVPFFQ